MATKKLASWALALTYGNLTAPVTEIAIKSIGNWAGCAVGGFSQPAPGLAYNAVKPFVAAQANSTILGSDVVVDAQTAALVNGIASHAEDFDDTHRDNPIHPSGPVLSALLAVAERKGSVTGQEFIAAFVAGVEAECKLGVSVFPEHYSAGWHITSTVGSIGAAVAVGKLIGLNEEQLQQAISFAAVQVTGMHVSFGTDAKPFHVGRAAQNGLVAALLVQGGLTGPLNGIEAERGWVHVVSTRENVTAEFGTLGSDWEITKNTFKPFPCDRIMHAEIDGWIQARAKALEQGLDLLKITNVTARAHPRVLFLTDHPEPQTGLAGKFSVYHAAAVALLTGEAGPAQFTDEAVRNSTTRALSRLVHVTTDQAVAEHEAYVTVEFEGGARVDVHVEHCIGSYENPMTTEQLKAKFVDQAGRRVGDSRAVKAWDAWYTNIADAPDVARIPHSY
ncbi:hypothetical protein RB595_008508 [Gaeumannomyces hyphopodioides]